VSAKPTTIGGLVIRRLDGLDERACALLEARNVVTVATHAANGGIHAQPVWADTDGEHVLLNSVAGRAWVRNVERDPRLTCTVVNLGNPYEFVEVRGRAIGPSREGADAHIHRLARKYLDLAEYPWLSPEEPRVLMRVVPERVVHMYPGDPELEAADEP
jgi:PPOX class probable F420-dependent enzyme